MRQVEFLARRGRIARDVRDRRRHVVDGAQALAKLAQLGNRAQRDARLHEPPPPLVVGAQAGLRVIRRVADAKRDKRQPARARRVGELLHHPFALHVADVGAHGVEILVEVVVLAHHGLARDPVPPAIDRDRRQPRQRLHARGGGEPDHVDEPVDVVALHRRIRLDEVDRARRMMDGPCIATSAALSVLPFADSGSASMIAKCPCAMKGGSDAATPARRRPTSGRRGAARPDRPARRTRRILSARRRRARSRRRRAAARPAAARSRSQPRPARRDSRGSSPDRRGGRRTGSRRRAAGARGCPSDRRAHPRATDARGTSPRPASDRRDSRARDTGPR
ncbi:Uncharacterised protein [Burkholderia pseudomallei]|nr:Uncharacterised protein [Burkholderia pseudomallei]